MFGGKVISQHKASVVVFCGNVTQVHLNLNLDLSPKKNPVFNDDHIIQKSLMENCIACFFWSLPAHHILGQVLQ